MASPVVGTSDAEIVPTVMAAPELACLRYWPVPPVALRSALVPPRASASCPLVICDAGRLGMSPATRAPHAGAAETEPFPVWGRKFFVALVVPASRVPVPPPATGIVGRSDVEIVPHAGAWVAEPVPVDVRKFLVAVVLPPRRAAVLAPLA